MCVVIIYKMDEWKTLEVRTIEVGSNNFIEVNLKQPPRGEELLYGISKGWFNENKEKRYKSNILFSQEIKEKLVETLNELQSKKEEL